MTTRAAFVWVIGFCMSLPALASGCYLDVDDFDVGDFDGDNFDDSMVDETGLCHAFCQQLMNCENIATDAFESCVSHCEAERSITPNTAVPGIHCVLGQICTSVIGYNCPSAPFPGTGGSNPVGTCAADSDCPSGSECIDHVCRQPCNTSCECAEGEMCEGGFCQVPTETPMTCTVDCDCPAGNVCLQGVCAPNG